MTTNNKYTFKDFKSDQQVRWCPGCGDIAILTAIQKAFAELDIAKEDFTIVSGIGCSSRFPYYMSTYGFHTIHGRAGAIASGVKTANPKLSVWQITGDGDAMAIGGNHFIHEIRRNIDINVILFNNEIYGLTKGQFSPTSKFGQITKTSPYGTIEQPFTPGELTIGAQGKFFARSIDNNVKHMTEIFLEAEKFKGTSVVEVLQNCVIFNDGAHINITHKKFQKDRQLMLKHGEPMLFGEDNKKGLVLDGLALKVVTVGEDGVKESDILVHDAYNPNPTLHSMLVGMKAPAFPVAFGVIRAVDTPTYDDLTVKQIEDVQAKATIKNMDDLLASGATWTIE